MSLLVDTHCHLYDQEAFPDPALVVAEAAQAGVGALMIIGIDSETNRAALRLAERFDNLFATIGWHPNNAAQFQTRCMVELRDLAQHPKCLAIGEIGLDLHHQYATLDEQYACLEPQIALAHDLELPIVFHCREAYELLVPFWMKMPPHPAVFHCFAGSMEQANHLVEHPTYFGFDGPITYPKSVESREILAALPRDRVLLETDAPYLAPVPYRGKRNHPAFVKHVADKTAEVWGVQVDEVAKISTANAIRFFGTSLAPFTHAAN